MLQCVLFCRLHEGCRFLPKAFYNISNLLSALSKCFVAVGSKHQVPLPARGLIVKSNVE